MVCICDSIPTWFSRNVHRLAKTGKRKEIFLATKFGFVTRPAHAKAGEKLLDGSPEYVHEAVERSLKKLGTDYIDLYYLHVSLSACDCDTNLLSKRPASGLKHAY